MQKSNNLLNCIFSGFQHTVHTYSRMNIKNWDIGKLLLQKRTTSSTSLVLKIHPKSHFKSLPNTTFFHFIIKLFSENTLKMILKPRPKIYCQNLCDENKFLSKELKTFTTFNTFLYQFVPQGEFISNRQGRQNMKKYQQQLAILCHKLSFLNTICQLFHWYLPRYFFILSS